MDIKSFKPRQTVYIVGDERRPRDKFSAVKAEVAKVGRKSGCGLPLAGTK